MGYTDFVGFVDDIYCVADNKTGKRRMAAREVPMALQPFAYAWLTGIRDFRFLRAIDTGKNSYSEVVPTRRSEDDDDIYLSMVDSVERHFDQNDWPPQPDIHVLRREV